MLSRFAAVVLLIVSAGLASAANPIKYEPIPQDKLKAYRALGGLACVHFWDREVRLDADFSAAPGVGKIPSVMFIIDKGKKLPEVPDAGVPFALRLHDDIFDEHMKALAKLPNLIAVLLISAKITDDGLKELAASKSLKYFYTYDTKVTDTGLKHLTTCKTLEGIVVDRGDFTDAGVAALTNLPGLRYLSLKNAEALTSACLPTIAGLKNLTHLSLNGCFRLGRDLKPLAGLPKLTHLNVSHTQAGTAAMWSLKGLKTLTDFSITGDVTDEVFEIAQEFPELTVLSIHATKITDAGLKDAKKLPKLTELHMDSCTKLTDAGMAELKHLPKLAHVELVFVPITDKGLEELAKVKTLTFLHVGGTKVTRAGLDAFKKALPDCKTYGSPSK